MSTNPYAPPRAEINSAAAGVSNRRRPLAVLLLLLFGYVHVALASIQVALFVAQLLANRLHTLAWSQLAPLVLAILALVYLVTLNIFIHRRHPIARLLGTVLLAFLALRVFQGAAPPAEAASRPGFEAGWYSSLATEAALYLYLAYAACWSRKARTYFASSSNPVQTNGERP